MTKTDIVSSIAKDTGITKDKAEKALGAFISSVKDSLSKGESVAIIGFGTFLVAKGLSKNKLNKFRKYPIIPSCEMRP